MCAVSKSCPFAPGNLPCQVHDREFARPIKRSTLADQRHAWNVMAGPRRKGGPDSEVMVSRGKIGHGHLSDDGTTFNTDGDVIG